MQQTTIDWGDVSENVTAGFWAFHNDNPEVFDRLTEMASDLAERGRTRIGIAMLFEVLRWEYQMESKTAEPFKLNNNYRAFYSRLIERRNPALAGIFAKRASVSDPA